MQDLQIIKTYNEFKNAFTTELNKQAEGFVRTGYLLKVARDTDILKESGYASVAEFAQAEYGLTKDVVSRYIAINDRFSENGYSDQLQEKYTQYGVAKLQEMLTLPDAVIDIMSPDMTKKDIQEMKREVKEDLEEAKNNPLGVIIEGQNMQQVDMSNLQKAMHQYFREKNKAFVQMAAVLKCDETENGEEEIEKVLDVLAPSGIGMLNPRVQGIGRIMISFRGKDMPVEVLSVRTQEKQAYMWRSFIVELRQAFAIGTDETAEQAWERIYGESFPLEKPEVAPVQPKVEEEPKVNNKEPVTQKPKAAAVKKTEEQKYNEQQAKIDRETKKKLEEMEDEQRMSVLPSEMPKTVHQIRCGKTFFEDILKGVKSFTLRKNDRDYKVGDILEKMEFDDGKHTGRTIKQEVIYKLEDFTGLVDGYCILGTKILEKPEE